MVQFPWTSTRRRSDSANDWMRTAVTAAQGITCQPVRVCTANPSSSIDRSGSNAYSKASAPAVKRRPTWAARRGRRGWAATVSSSKRLPSGVPQAVRPITSRAGRRKWNQARTQRPRAMPTSRITAPVRMRDTRRE